MNGQPRIVWQKYLGTIDAIVKRVDDSKPPQPKQTVIFEAGGIIALLRITQRLGLLELINQVAPKRKQGPTVGHYLVLAILNRALAPLSKLAIGQWYEQTVLRRLWGFDKAAFSSQRFWDHMDRLSEKQLETIQQKLLPRLNYAVDHDALQRLSQERLGRTLLVSNRPDWHARTVVETYRSLSAVEEAFKHMKHTDFLRFRPAYHWTDQKLRVHAFYCVSALLAGTLAHKTAFQAGVELSLPALLKELSAIREVAIIYPPGSLAHRKDYITLTRLSARQKKLAQAFEIGETLKQKG